MVPQKHQGSRCARRVREQEGVLGSSGEVLVLVEVGQEDVVVTGRCWWVGRSGEDLMLVWWLETSTSIPRKTFLIDSSATPVNLWFVIRM